MMRILLPISIHHSAVLMDSCVDGHGGADVGAFVAEISKGEVTWSGAVACYISITSSNGFATSFHCTNDDGE